MPRGTRDCAKGRRLIAFVDYRGIAGRNTISRPFRTISRYGVNSEERLPTGLPTRCYGVLESAAYEEGFPVISRFVHWDHSQRRAIRLPDKEFRFRSYSDMSFSDISRTEQHFLGCRSLHVAMQR